MIFEQKMIAEHGVEAIQHRLQMGVLLDQTQHNAHPQVWTFIV
jgi:hypothetical protein